MEAPVALADVNPATHSPFSAALCAADDGNFFICDCFRITRTHSGKANFSKIIFFFHPNKNDFVKINQNPPPRGGGLWLILACQINLNLLLP